MEARWRTAQSNHVRPLKRCCLLGYAAQKSAARIAIATIVLSQRVRGGPLDGGIPSMIRMDDGDRLISYHGPFTSRLLVCRRL